MADPGSKQRAWGCLVCIGAKDGGERKVHARTQPSRRSRRRPLHRLSAPPAPQVELRKAEVAVGRKPGCLVLYADTTISSVHCKLSLAAGGAAGAECRSPRAPFGPLVPQVWLEDCSVNGTYVNAQKIGRGNKVRLSHGDKIGLLKPCGGAEAPPYAFIFHDLTAGLAAEDFPLLGVRAPPSQPTTPSQASTPLAPTPHPAERETPAPPHSLSRSTTGSVHSMTPGDEEADKADEPYASINLCAKASPAAQSPAGSSRRLLRRRPRPAAGMGRAANGRAGAPL